MATAMEMVTVMPVAAAHPFVVKSEQATQEQHSTTVRHKEHKRLSKAILWFLCLFVASFLLRGEFSFLFFVETFLIFLEPGFEIL